MSIVGFQLRFDEAAFLDARVVPVDFAVAGLGRLGIIHLLV